MTIIITITIIIYYKTHSDYTDVFAYNLHYVSVFYSCRLQLSTVILIIIPPVTKVTSSLSSILNTTVLTCKEVYKTIFVTIKLVVYFISLNQ